MYQYQNSHFPIFPPTRHWLAYHLRGKIEALKAAQQKAAYLAEALGSVIRIIKNGPTGVFPTPMQSNVRSSDVYSFDHFCTIKKSYSMLVRFENIDK